MFDNRENSKIWPIFGFGGHNFDLSEKLTETFSLSLLTSFQTLFPFSSTTNRSRDRHVLDPPPPSRWWQILSASGARVNNYS